MAEKKVFKVTGMGCQNCAAKVKKALEALPGVEKAEVDFPAKQAEITLSAPVADQALKDAVAAAGKYALV